MKGDENFVMKVVRRRGRGGYAMFAFAGLRGRLGKLVQPFEFVNSTNKWLKHIDRYFVKGFGWMANGVPTVGNSPREVAEEISRTCNARRYKSVVFVGNSAGGYAALLMASLVQINGSVSCVAFQPRTFGPQVPIDIKKVLRDRVSYYLHVNMTMKHKPKTHSHHPCHCKRLRKYSTVKLIKHKEWDLKKYRNTGMRKAICKFEGH